MAETFDQTVKSLAASIEEHMSTKTVVGEPVICGDTIIFPMADVSFGIAAGTFNQEKKTNGTGGAGVRMSPSAVLIIQNGTSKVINIKDKDSMNKLIEMIPDLLNKLTGSKGSKSQQESPVQGSPVQEERITPAPVSTSEADIIDVVESATGEIEEDLAAQGDPE